MRIKRWTGPAAICAVVVILGAGSAAAATGGSFILGRSNTASTPTTLTNTSGTALSLRAPTGKPPLAVSNSTRVRRLNADQLDGLTAWSMRTFLVMGVTDEDVPRRPSLYKVAAGVRQLHVRLQGGGGVGGLDTPSHGGGQGAFVEALLAVRPGQMLAVEAGHGGIVDEERVLASASAAVIKDVASGQRISAGGGGDGEDVRPGPGGKFQSDWAGGQLLLEVRQGQAGFRSKTGLPDDPGQGGGPPEVAGSGGTGERLDSGGMPGYVAITPLGLR